MTISPRLSERHWSEVCDDADIVGRCGRRPDERTGDRHALLRLLSDFWTNQCPDGYGTPPFTPMPSFDSVEGPGREGGAGGRERRRLSFLWRRSVVPSQGVITDLFTLSFARRPSASQPTRWKVRLCAWACFEELGVWVSE